MKPSHHLSGHSLHANPSPPPPAAHDRRSRPLLCSPQTPQFVINTFGAGGFSFSSYTDISKTTLGNLVSSLNGTTDVVIPYCQGFSDYFHVLDCNLNKTSLALVRTHTHNPRHPSPHPIIPIPPR